MRLSFYRFVFFRFGQKTKPSGSVFHWLGFSSVRFDYFKVELNLKIGSVSVNRMALSCDATIVLRMRLLHVVAFSKKLRWLAPSKQNFYDFMLLTIFKILNNMCTKCSFNFLINSY